MSGGIPEAFLTQIIANIDEDTPRLVFADWLEENGMEERAEFIRVQIERARLPVWDGAQVRLRLREQDLLRRNGEEWLAAFPVIEGARWEGFRRGIVAEVSFASFEAMRANAQACRAAAPVEAVTVRWPRQREGRLAGAPIAELRELSLVGEPDYRAFEWVAESPQLSTLRRLTARGLFYQSLERLVASPHLANLKSLRVPSNNLGNEGLHALAGSATLVALEELDYSSQSRRERYHHDPAIREAGMGALMGWRGLATVRSLTLTGNDLTREGLRTMLRSPNAGALKELFLRDCGLDGQAMAEFESAQAGFRLETLDLGENLLKDVGAEYVALVSCLHELKVLRIDRCEIAQTGAGLFAKKATFFGDLRRLDVGHNYFGPTGLTGLLAREAPLLHTLCMRDNNLLDTGVRILAGSPASDSLLAVDLSQNSLGPAAATALGESAQLRELLVLRMSDNPIEESAASSLAASPLGQRLAVLELDNLPLTHKSPPPGEDCIPF